MNHPIRLGHYYCNSFYISFVFSYKPLARGRRGGTPEEGGQEEGAQESRPRES